MVSGFFLAFCAAGLLILLKWAMDYRVRRRRWSWGLDEGDVRVAGECEVRGRGSGRGRSRSLERRMCKSLRISIDGAERGWKEAGRVIRIREDDWKWR